MAEQECPSCKGYRLKPETLAVKIVGKHIGEITQLSVVEANEFFHELKLSEKDMQIARLILREIDERLGFLVNVGLDYLSLSRAAGTLSGGEAQRIRLATQIGSRLTGVLYILDEPSIGLHQRDNDRLVSTLQSMRDIGNTLIVVEHDEDTMIASDILSVLVSTQETIKKESQHFLLLVLMFFALTRQKGIHSGRRMYLIGLDLSMVTK